MQGQGTKLVVTSEEDGTMLLNHQVADANAYQRQGGEFIGLFFLAAMRASDRSCILWSWCKRGQPYSSTLSNFNICGTACVSVESSIRRYNNPTAKTTPLCQRARSRTVQKQCMSIFRGCTCR